MNKLSSAALLLLFVLSGCGTPRPESGSVHGALIVWKTPGLSYADQGFVRRSGDEVGMQIYASGRALMRLKAAPRTICIQSHCMNPRSFHDRFLSVHYPPTLLYNLLQGRPLLGGAGMRRVRNGFVQKVTRPGKYAIVYRSFNGSIEFRDTINAITVKIIRED